MKENPSRMTQVLALLTLTVFALCLLLVLLSGASCYRNLVDRGEENYGRRTAVQYLTTRVRQAQRVEIGDFEGCEALILEETVEDECYTTRVYCYDGWLRELYTVPGAELPPKAGTEILEAETLTLTREGSLLRIALGEEELFLHLPEVGS
jgi:hypothetical protein